MGMQFSVSVAWQETVPRCLSGKRLGAWSITRYTPQGFGGSFPSGGMGGRGPAQHPPTQCGEGGVVYGGG